MTSGEGGTPDLGGPPAEHLAAGSDAPRPPGRRGHRRVVRKGPEREAVAGLSADEAPSAWADEVAGSGSAGDANDDRLRRDVPPHW